MMAKVRRRRTAAASGERSSDNERSSRLRPMTAGRRPGGRRPTPPVAGRLWHEYAVARRPDRQGAERVERGGDGLRLQVPLVDDRGVVGALDDDVRLAEASDDVAAVV